jgi:predicted ATPase/class 3 adenylate cyclase
LATLPVGTLTFLLTDLVASTRTWEEHTRAMREAMVEHDAIVYGAVERHSGAIVESGREGDSILAVFVVSRDAAACALDVQRGFHAASWPGGLQLRTRIALHTCEVELRGGHYFGPALNRCARVLALGHGGQILVTQATHALLTEAPPPDAELIDLGVHKLKDLRRAERIYQLTDSTLPERFPPLQTRGEYRTNLPILLTSFVGRDRELAELRGMLRHERLLTIVGTGGAGKTRLSKELAVASAPDVSGGAWFVDLAPVSDPKVVAHAAAGALDLEEQVGRPIVDTLSERLSERPTLLVLDNCEHLLAACAALANTLLSSCPDLRIVATSREPLNLAGEVVWRVPALADAEATRLFVERARMRSRGFELTERNASTVMEICRRVDGTPLAIELAAARIAMMGPEEILRRLEGGLGLLAGGDRTVAERQRTLEATIDWSHQLLPTEERVLLRRLAVFAGTFSVDAAETVGEGTDLPRATILDLLGQLVAKSLVQRTDDRYGLLETIRAFAGAKLDAAGERMSTGDRHATYYARLAASRRPRALGSWLELVDAEHDNLRSALGWCIAEAPERGARIATSLYEFWLFRGYPREARAFLDALAARLDEGSASHSRVLLESGVFAYTAGEFDVAPALIAAGLSGARATGDREQVARGLVFKGAVALAAGRVEQAQAALDEGLGIARDAGLGRIEADALHHLGALASVRGDQAGAATLFTASLERREELDIADEAGTTLTLRACVRLLARDLAPAREDITRALRIALALRDRRVAWSLDVLSCLAALDGSADRAFRLGGAAEALFEVSGQRPPEMWSRIVQPLMDEARDTLGEDAANDAWRAGRALTFDQALHYGLDPLGSVSAVA